MDPLLRPFVEATSETDADRELAALVEQQALPLARVIVRRKLRGMSGDDLARREIQDRDDVVSDAMVTLVERLHDVRVRPGAAEIDSLAGYTAAVVHSACAHYLRRRYPERTRLKNRLRYLLDSSSALAVWTVDDDLVCGLASWRDRPIDPSALSRANRTAEGRREGWMAMTRAELEPAAASLFASIGGPIEFDAFVRIACSIAGVVEPRAAADAIVIASSAPSHDVTLDQHRALDRVWADVRELPVRQRLALLLNLRDVTGAGLLWLLPVAGIATIRQIAATLEIPDTEFAALWRELPLDDAAIAARLGATRQQVINLRMAARKRLFNRLARQGSRAAQDASPRANLTAVSSSLRGSA